MVTTFLLNYSQEKSNVFIRKRIKHSLFLLFGLQNKKAPIDLLFLEFHIDNDCGKDFFPPSEIMLVKVGAMQQESRQELHEQHI